MDQPLGFSQTPDYLVGWEKGQQVLVRFDASASFGTGSDKTNLASFSNLQLAALVAGGTSVVLNSAKTGLVLNDGSTTSLATGGSGIALTAAQTSAGATSGAVAVTSAGVLVGPDPTVLSSRALAGRPSPPGRNVLLIGGSETMRANCVLNVPIGGFSGDGTTLTIVTTIQHLLHDGAEVFIAAEDALAPSQNGGTITFDNMFAWGQVTVIDANTLTIPYWSANAGTPYATLTGTNTITFDLCLQQVFSANGKFQEMQRWLGFPYTQLMNLGTGSNNSSHMVERIPAVVALVKQGLVTDVRGTFGIGNSIAYGNNHGLTVAQIKSMITTDMTKFWTALAPYGVAIEMEAMIAQGAASGISIGAQIQIGEMLKSFALASGDPGRRVTMLDDFNLSYDPTTGQERIRYRRNGTDNDHPANEGAVFFGRNHAEAQAVQESFWGDISHNPLDNSKTDATGIAIQYFDPLTSATPTSAASALDAKCSGVIPDLVTNITTTGNAGRSIVFSYEQSHGQWFIVAKITAGAANDTFAIKLTNKSGSRQLFNVINAASGHKFLCAADFAFMPTNPDAQTWTSVETYFQATMSYRSISNRQALLAADSMNYGLFKDGPMTSSRMGPSVMKPFTIPAASSCTDAGLNFLITANAAGTAILMIGAPTLRDIT